ncbi:MAG: DNA translocase FtsK 4TM domain-containing protein [Acidobacteriota bacterium]
MSMGSFWAHKRVMEIEGILMLTLSTVLLLSLLTYAPSDPSLNSTGLSPEAPSVQNKAGVAGAYASDVLLQLFGITSFLLPLLGIVVGFRLLLHRPTTSVLSRVAGALVLVAVGAAALAILLPAHRYRNLSFGGGFGEALGTYLVSRLSPWGGLLLCAALALIAMLFLTRLSLPDMLRLCFRPFSSLAELVAGRLRALKDRHERTQLRKEVLAKHASRVSSPALPPSAAAALPAQPERAPAVTAAPKRPVQEELPFPDQPRPATSRFTLPSPSLLDNPAPDNAVDEREFHAKAKVIQSKFAEFGIEGAVTDMHPGPVITTFEYQASAGVKYSRMQGMVDDLSLALKAESVMIDKIAGRSTVGIQVPNVKRERICLREILTSQQYQRSHALLKLALGKNTTGEPFVADLARMPHLLIAGATGMGKSVSLHSMICSLLYSATPEQVRLILIDPKRVELTVYADMPHLYCEVITEPRKAVIALKNAKRELDRRTQLLFRTQVRNIDQYNHKVHTKDLPKHLPDERFELLPYLVIVIDELADLMAEMPKEVEHQIGRLAQMARAVGIHLILATQRPSVDVITGTIKNNLPARISFRVSQKVDSRTILDTGGAEHLLGDGDMLFLAPGTSRLQRIHGAYVSEEEVMRIANFLRREGKPSYNHAFLKDLDKEETEAGGGGEVQDELFRQAVELVLSSGQASASHLQRRLKLGYNRAARLIDIMEEQGIVGPSTGPNKSREILVKPDYLDTLKPPSD